MDADGHSRTVNYVADAAGFRATVETNEPGTKTSAPADTQYFSSSAEVRPAAVAPAVPAAQFVLQKPLVVPGVAAPVIVRPLPVAYATKPAAPIYDFGQAPLAYAYQA